MHIGYRRTVLVIWPDRYNFDISYGKNPSGALSTLEEAISSGKQTGKEHELADFILRTANAREQPQSEIAKIVCSAARRWNNNDLWKRTIRACKAETSLSVVGTPLLCDSAITFGFQGVRPRSVFYC